jgi:hypothetical protein
MSLVKAVLKGIKDKECERFTILERPPVPYLPEKILSKKRFPP